MKLLDWEDNHGDVEQGFGTITKREILANFGDGEDDNVEYEHVRFYGEFYRYQHRWQSLLFST